MCFDLAMANNRGIQRGVLKDAEDVEDMEVANAGKGDLMLKKGFFWYQMCLQPNKHLHEQLLNL